MKNVWIKNGIILLIFIALHNAAQGQQDSVSSLENAVDVLMERLENESDDEMVASDELLEVLSDNEVQSKPNLNALSYEVAVQKLHLSDFQYYKLQLYIEEQGQLLTVYELVAVEGYSRADMERLLPLVTVQPVVSGSRFFKDFFAKGRATFFTRYGRVLERQAGYDTTQSRHYDGTPGHACFRLTYESQNQFVLKLSGEKDAGERLPFFSGSLCLKRIGVINAAVIGDYRLNFGQGLVLGSSLLSGKGGGVSAIRRFSTGIRPVALTNEGEALRGAAVTLGKTRFSGTLFAGRQFGTLQNSAGFDVCYRRPNFTVGARVAGYSVTDTTATEPAARWRSSLTPTGCNAAIDYHAIAHKVLLAGELAVNERLRPAVLQSLIINVVPTSRLAVVFRYYDKDYAAPLGSAFGSTSANAGETGIYLVSSTILGQHCTLDLYGDAYRLTWLSYRTDAPITAMDAGAALHVDLSRNSSLHLKYNWKCKPENNSESVMLKQIRDHQRHRIRLQWVNTPFPALKLKTEVAWLRNCYPQQQTHYDGLLLYQDVAFQISKPALAVHLRVAYFDTDRYDERLYAYEDDVYYAFTIGSYYYQGIRGYLVLRYKYKWLSVWLRLSQTYYINRNDISSGLTYINKPHKTELKLQLMFSL